MLRGTHDRSTATLASGSPQLPQSPPAKRLKRYGEQLPLLSWGGMRHELRRNWPLMLMVLPGVLLIFVFAYLPIVGILIAFEDYRDYLGIFASPFIGFENFKFLFGTGSAWMITYNTIFMNVLFISSSLIGSVLIALLLNEVRESSRYLSKFYQTALLFPYFISYVIVSYFVSAFLNADTGVANHLLAALHLQSIDWYNSPQYWPAILTIVNLWKGAGYGSIIYLAGIVAINPEYFEAARIDGAGKLQQIRYITLPQLKPLIIIVVLLGIAHILFADFGLFFQVTKNSSTLYPTTDVINTYVYRSLITLPDLGLPAAAGVYQSVVSCVMILIVNGIVRRIDRERALF